MLDDIFDFFNGSYLATIATLLIGCYILGDTVRLCLYIFDASRRNFRRALPNRRDRVR